ncbi:hypothetical protein QFZ46_002522 [Microbacterium murale]|uniref:Uncharacterized protein n=1 Tax=Microbacterium murale TaxID=1081040 RepID=A0ABU0PBS0_9MICO|nr:hypothetical protein [Microbacterium murale]
MSNEFRGKIERSSFGTQSAKAARRTVPASKAQSLVSRSMTGKIQSRQLKGREGK